MPIEAELDDDAMSRVERPLDADEIRQAFRTLATAPETTTEEFGGFVAGNYRMFVAQTERLSAKGGGKAGAVRSRRLVRRGGKRDLADQMKRKQVAHAARQAADAARKRARGIPTKDAA